MCIKTNASWRITNINYAYIYLTWCKIRLVMTAVDGHYTYVWLCIWCYPTFKYALGVLFCAYDDDEMLHSDIWTIYHTAAANAAAVAAKKQQNYEWEEGDRVSECNDTEIRWIWNTCMCMCCISKQASRRERERESESGKQRRDFNRRAISTILYLWHYTSYNSMCMCIT